MVEWSIGPSAIRPLMEEVRNGRMVDLAVGHSSFYFRYLHIPLSISKTEEMKTRISVSQIKSMNFLKMTKTKTYFRKIYQSLGFPIKINDLSENEQNEKYVSEKYHSLCVPSFFMKTATFVMPF